MTNCRWLRMCLVCVVSCCGLGAGCNKGDDGGDDPFVYEPDPTVFSEEADAQDFIEVQSADGTPISVVNNMVIVVLADSEDVSEGARLAGLVSGEPVGQIPAWGLLQIQLQTDTGAGLLGAIATLEADPAVAHAGYDLEIIPYAGSCPVETDIEKLVGTERCYYQDIEANVAMSIMRELADEIVLFDVVIGLVDTGVNHTHPEFDDVHIYDAMASGGLPSPALEDTDGHGTQVAAIMVADDDGVDVGGLATGALGDKVSLVADKVSPNMFATLDAVYRVVDAGADVVNMSFGVRRADGSMQAERAAFESCLENTPNVLFVASAGNRPVPITATSDIPAGIPADNLITVGGTQACQITAPYTDSARGDVIDIAAPAQGLFVIHPTRTHEMQMVEGNSFAAPQVTAVAAVLKSMDPTLSPRSMRDDYIVRMSNFGPAEVGGRVLLYPYVIGQLLLDKGLVSDDILDHNSDGELDPTDVIYCTICNCLSWCTVEGEHSFQPTSSDQALGGGNASSFYVNFVDGEYSFSLNCNNCQLDLGSYSVGGMGGTSVNAYYSAVEGTTVYNGQGTAGELRVAGCVIGGRVVDPNIGQIIYEVMFHGRFHGDLAINKMITEPLSTETYDTTFEGAFELPWFVSTTSETDAMAMFLEKKCVNGRTRPVLSTLVFLLGDDIVRRWGESRSGADARLNLVASNLSREEAIAWTHLETPPATTAQALHLTLLEAEGPQAVDDQVELPIIVPDCSGQQEPACAQASGVALGFYDWSNGQATRALQAQSGTVTLFRESEQVIRATLNVTFDDASEIADWDMRFLQ